MRTEKIVSERINSKSKTLFIEITPVEHSVLKIESAVSGCTMCDIVRDRLIAPLKEKHKTLLNRSGAEK